MRFNEPWFLLLFLLLPLLFFIIPATKSSILYSNINIFKDIKNKFFFHPRLILLLLRLLTFAFIIIALARPQTGKKISEITSYGVDIVLALDTSGSMQALDFKIKGDPTSRLAIVKKVVSDFVLKRKNDRIGLVVFGEEAYTQCPLTLDHGVVLDFLKQVKIGMAGDATAVGSALGVAVKRIKDIKAKSKIVVLLTDGRNNAGRITPEKAAELAKHYQVKVYTIGVGTRGKAPFLVDTIFGKRYVYQQVDIDEKSLENISQITGGKYYRATDTEELVDIYQEIDKAEKTEIKVKEYTEYNEKFTVFLILAIIFLILEIILSNTRLRIIP